MLPDDLFGGVALDPRGAGVPVRHEPVGVEHEDRVVGHPLHQQPKPLFADANRESRSSWRDFLLGLKARGLHGVEFVVADDHAGLRAALREVLAEAAYQRCYVHFLRNALDYVPRRVDDACLQELRWLYDRRDLPEARRDLAAWLAKWSGKYPKLTGWVEENIEETLTPAFAEAGSSTGCRASTINISNRPTCWSASTRRSNAELTWCASSQMGKA